METYVVHFKLHSSSGLLTGHSTNMQQEEETFWFMDFDSWFVITLKAVFCQVSDILSFLKLFFLFHRRRWCFVMCWSGLLMNSQATWWMRAFALGDFDPLDYICLMCHVRGLSFLWGRDRLNWEWIETTRHKGSKKNSLCNQRSWWSIARLFAIRQ